jgi:hypothetical protein
MTPGAQGGQGVGRWQRAWDAIDERLALSRLAYPVPTHANGIGYILGGITFFGFLILAATGIWLAQFYHPTPTTARESVVYIINVAPLGDLVRGIHFWVANLVSHSATPHGSRPARRANTRGRRRSPAGPHSPLILVLSRSAPEDGRQSQTGALDSTDNSWRRDGTVRAGPMALRWITPKLGY